MEESERPTKRMKSNHKDSPSQEELSQTPSIQQDATAKTDNTNGTSHPNPTDPPLSKNAQKRLLKKQQWEDKKPERKLARKEKNAARKQRQRALKARLISENGGVEPPPSSPKISLNQAVTLPITILIDCDFDDLMRDNERISLAGQITRSYSENRKSLFRVNLGIASYGGKLKERFENVLAHHKSWKGVRWVEEDFVRAAEKAREWMGEEGWKMGGVFEKYRGMDVEELKGDGEVVYLSAESDETLTELKPFSTYIVGGLVDKNREKGICFRRANEKGVKTARLPIGDFMEMQSRKVLATNHVNEIMIKWLECGDWGEAFLKVIPKRKGGKLKGQDGQADEEDGDEIAGEVDVAGHEDQNGNTSLAEGAGVADTENVPVDRQHLKGEES